MDCQQARALLLDRRRGTLGAEARAPLEEHLEGCAACRAEDAADAELSNLLEKRLPRPRAPEALRRRVAQRAGPASAARRLFRGRLAPSSALAALAGAALALLVVFGWWRARPSDAMVAEAVNDHLRVLYSERPIEVEPGIHQVKPWFEGRLDFAPVVAFAGDDEFPLQGGSVAWFIDRKAATFVYKRRLHLVTLFVFRADGLPWPAVAPEPVGSARGVASDARGFHVLLWRSGDLGYALVSDVDARELATLGAKVAGGE